MRICIPAGNMMSHELAYYDDSVNSVETFVFIFEEDRDVTIAAINITALSTVSKIIYSDSQPYKRLIKGAYA